MTALVVVGMILLAVMLLLFSAVRIHLWYRDGQFTCVVWYLFLRFDLSPDKLLAKLEKRGEKPEKKKKRRAAKPKKEREKVPRTFGENLDLVRQVIRASSKAVRRLCRGITIYKVRAQIQVAREDAHQTAISYAKVTMAVSALISVLDSLFRLRRPKIHIAPDFTRDRTRGEISLRIRIRPITALGAGISFAFTLFRTLSKPQKVTVKKKSKGGKIHEPAASHQ